MVNNYNRVANMNEYFQTQNNFAYRRLINNIKFDSTKGEFVTLESTQSFNPLKMPWIIKIVDMQHDFIPENMISLTKFSDIEEKAFDYYKCTTQELLKQIIDDYLSYDIKK